jgi:acetyl-CoA synthetase
MVATTFRPSLDNNVAEIMDAEDPLFILTLPVPPENQKEWYTLQQVIWCILPIRLRMFLIMKTMIFLCTADIGWITGHSYILYGPLLNGATTVIFEGVPIQISVVAFGRPTSIRSPSFTRHQQPLELWQRKHRICATLPIDFFESDWISGRTPMRKRHWYNNHVGEMSCRGYVVANGRNYDFANCFVNLQNQRMLLYHYREFKPFDG